MHAHSGLRILRMNPCCSLADIHPSSLHDNDIGDTSQRLLSKITSPGNRPALISDYRSEITSYRNETSTSKTTVPAPFSYGLSCSATHTIFLNTVFGSGSTWTWTNRPSPPNRPGTPSRWSNGIRHTLPWRQRLHGDAHSCPLYLVTIAAAPRTQGMLRRPHTTA
jgi:hypothetical protein